MIRLNDLTVSPKSCCKRLVNEFTPKSKKSKSRWYVASDSPKCSKLLRCYWFIVDALGHVDGSEIHLSSSDRWQKKTKQPCTYLDIWHINSQQWRISFIRSPKQKLSNSPANYKNIIVKQETKWTYESMGSFCSMQMHHSKPPFFFVCVESVGLVVLKTTSW